MDGIRMNVRRGLRQLLIAIVAVVLPFVVVEVALRGAYLVRNSFVTDIPLPYAVEDAYGPTPPWLDGLRVLEPDDDLLWKSRPNLQRKYVDVFSPVYRNEDRTSLLRQVFPVLPDWLKDNPTWQISLNSSGFRDVEFPATKSSSVFRIVCVGDSWTFGANVGQESTYPEELQTLLRREYPQARFEVFNLGVLGYSSYQGLGLLRAKIAELAPDFVVIAFAMNDSNIAGYRDKDVPASNQRQDSTVTRLNRLLEKTEMYKLLRYSIRISKYKPASLGDGLARVDRSARKPEEAIDYEKLEPWMRVSPVDYKNNILEMIKLARNGNAGVALLYNQLSTDAGVVAGIGQLGPTSPYWRVLEQVSETERIPLVDSSSLIAQARRQIEEELERRLGLHVGQPSRSRSDGEVEVIFRVYSADWPVSKALYIAGAHPKLGGLVPNSVAMYDDGTHGDQKAGDHVWSYSATFPRRTSLFYVYTNSGEQGKWEGLDIPHLRNYTVAAGEDADTIYRPIESFGKIYMQADGWHTNALGYELIAQALLDVLKRDGKVQEFVRNRPTIP